MRENIYPDIYREFPFLLAEKSPPKSLTEDDFEEFNILYSQILNEFEKKSEYKNKILGNLFTVLLLKIKEIFWSAYDPIEEGSRDSQIVNSFKKLLEKEFKKLLEDNQNDVKLQVQYFANKLNLHPNYLNSVIKSKTGRTVNDWIAQRMLSIAKMLIKNTSYSSKEIAYKLGYTEPTHFSRFFKKQMQISPSAFRKLTKNQ
ncbi:MAG: helix-turn-helix domain-containing protein [Flavobacteriales bacterium]